MRYTPGRSPGPTSICRPCRPRNCAYASSGSAASIAPPSSTTKTPAESSRSRTTLPPPTSRFTLHHFCPLLITHYIVVPLCFFLPTENPLNTIFIIKLSIRSKWHIMQLLKPFFVCSFCKFVKNSFQLVICSTNDKYGKRITQFWLECRRCHPVCGRKFKSTTFEMGIDNPVVLLWRELAFHRSIAKLCKR